MRKLENLEPKNVFRFFEDICSIPHGSRNLKAISDYLVKFAVDRNLYYRQDESLNVLIKKPASKGAENAPIVIIQGHMDMVAVKDADCDKNMVTDGLDLVIDGDLLSAEGTSLGGDDGIAVAYALALLDDDSIVHPGIEAIFTTNEEIGMFGAAAFDTKDIEGKIFMNADSEDEGVFTVSCAGGASVISTLKTDRKNVSQKGIEIILDNFTGGHSGVEINKGRMNADCAMGRLLFRLQKKIKFNISSINGGEKDNAIANACSLILGMDEKDINKAKVVIEELFAEIKDEQSIADPDARLRINDVDIDSVISDENTKSVIYILTSVPQGVQKMNPTIEGLVQTSLNLGILETTDDEIRFVYSVRSSKKSEKNHLIDLIKGLTEHEGGSSTVEGDYPGWDLRKESLLRDVMIEEYEKIYGEKPVVEGIHAGLECGIFAEKIDDLDAVSFGPQMNDIHTTKETLSISSTERTWKLILNVMANFASRG